MSERPVIGFIGTGVMGHSMAMHLLDAGYSLHVYNRTRSKAQALLDRGAQWQESPGEVAARAAIVISIVGFPQDVEAIYLDAGGIVERAAPGSTVIDMTTSSPELAVRIHAAAAARDVAALDAPVSGGDVGAREARLSIMVGGEAAAFERAKPILACMGKQIVHQGSAGAGQHTKLCNQIAIASVMVAVSEALTYALRSGLEPRTVLESISSGAAGSWLLTNLAPRMLDGDFAPGFLVRHFQKDMRLALESAARRKLELPGLTLAKQLYDRLAEEGGAEDGTQALFRLYEEQLRAAD